MSLINSTEGPDILIVDDTPANLKVLTTMLKDNGYRVRPAISGPIALKAVQSAPPDLILLDIMMPGMDGYEVCAVLKGAAATQDIPVIFISALDETWDKVKAFKAGAVDYITKPFQIEEVLARIHTHLVLDQQRKEILALNSLKDLLIRTVSHDLKNPINNVMGYAEIILTQEDVAQSREHTARLVQSIYQTADHMHNLVSRLLDLSSIEEGKSFELNLISLRDVVELQLSQFELQIAQKQLNLTAELAETGTLILGDQHWIGEAFGNLLSNAIKYTPDKGSLKVILAPEGEMVKLAVQDSGLGIPADSIPHLFDKFYRVDAHKGIKGTGLGLSIAQAIIARHQGNIKVESELHRGSTFTILIPRYKAS